MLHINANNLNEVLESNKVVVVDFWASWCGPCMAIAPIYESVADKMSNKITFAKCNVDESQDVAIKFGINSIPSILIFVDGVLKDKSVGLINESILESFILRNVK